MKPSALLVAAAIAIVPGFAVAKDQHSAAKSKSQGYGYAYAPMDRSEAIQIATPKRQSGAIAISRARS